MFTADYFAASFFAPDIFPRVEATDRPIRQLLTSQQAADLYLAWTTRATAGRSQLYVDRRLAWHGAGTRTVVPVPQAGAQVQVVSVWTVAEATDYSAGFPAPAAASGDHAQLSWAGGTYLDPTGQDDIAGFHVYGSSAPGGAVSYAAPLATVPAYAAPVPDDGFGRGGFGRGGFGRAASGYSWTSPRLASGAWQFDVRPFDRAGNEQATTTPVAVTIAGRPGPPAQDNNGNRLTYTYNSTTRVATLSWFAPGG